MIRTRLKTIRARLKKIDVFLILPILLSQNSHGVPTLRIVGSSAVFPFAATVAEHFNYKTHESMPIIEAIGTGAGIKLFCGNINGADSVITSRPLTKKEEESCKDRGITFQKFTIGQDGLVLIQNKKAVPLSLSLQELDQTLSEKVQLGKNCIDNPYKDWKQIQEILPAQPIRILGPAPSTGTYDILIEKLKNTCGPFIRHDGAYIEAPANENLIVQKVLSRADTMGIVTFSFYDQNRTRLQAIPLKWGASFCPFHSKQKLSFKPSSLFYISKRIIPITMERAVRMLLNLHHLRPLGERVFK